MTFHIREATDADFPVMSAIWNELNPAHAASADTFAREIQEGRASPLGLHLAYWVVEQAGQVTAYASVEQYAGLYHLHRFHAGVYVLPQARGQGIGTALAQTLKTHLQERQALEVLAGHYESDGAASLLMGRYGLVEIQRYFDSHLDLSEFNFAAWTAQMTLPDGWRVTSYADLQQALGQENALHTFYDLYTDTVRDVPAPGERTMPTLERFQKRLSDEHFLPERVLLAFTPDGQAAAFTELWASEDDDPQRLKIGFTCTRREWRGRGLALALKLRAMQAAHAGGFRHITTNAESANAPMLSLNDRLGFRRDEAYVECRWGKV